MQKIVFSLAAFFLLLPFVQAAVSWRDTCYITNTRITPDVRSKDILGVTIDFDSFLSYDTRHTKKEPFNFVIEINILDAAGKQVRAVSTGSAFNQKGFAGAEKTEHIVSVRTKINQHFFVPYYCLDLPPGQVKLQYLIRCSVRDTSFDEKLRTVYADGVTTQKFAISKPPSNKVRLLCTAVRVSPTDHGKNWDFGLSGLPDPEFKVILSNAVQPDFLYTSASIENSLSAAWIDYSTPFFISEGDKITLGIYDKDTIIDDLIGMESHTLDEWLEISKSVKELKFDQVLFCTVKIEKMK